MIINRDFNSVKNQTKRLSFGTVDRQLHDKCKTAIIRPEKVRNQSNLTTARNNVPSLPNLQAYFLTRVNTGKPVAFTGSAKYKLDSESGALSITHSGSGKAVLHWGVNGWQQPPTDALPEKSTISKGVANSPMESSNGKLSITIPNATQFEKINYVVKYPETGDCDNNNNNDYLINIARELTRAKKGEDGQSETAEILDYITEKESSEGDKALNWNIATRFDFVSKILDEPVDSEKLMALVSSYIDLSVNHLPNRKVDPDKGLGLEATRKNALRFSHLASSSEKLSAKTLDQLENNKDFYPIIRNIIKNLRGATGNLESLGSFIQKESLSIVRDDRWRNIESYKDTEDGRGTYLFQLQRKLHNALSPEDAKIMDAYIDFLKSGGDMEVYNKSLESQGIDMKEYKNYFTNPPIYHQNETAALIERIEGLRNAVTKFFEGPAIEESLNALNGSLEKGLNDKLHKLVQMPDKTRQPEAVLKMLAEIRPALKEKIFEAEGKTLKQLIILDLKLEDIGKIAIKKLSAAANTEGKGSLNKELLENICTILDIISCDGKSQKTCEEIKIVKAELQKQIENINPADRDWNLLTKARLDRALRVLGTHEKHIAELYQKPVSDLTKILKLDNKIAKEYSEHLLRLESSFDFSKLLQVTRRETRKNAGLPPWDVISTGTAQGKVIAADTLYDLPALKELKVPVVAVLNKVTGSEDIPPGVKAIICGEGVDVLSHLGIRARQDGVALIVSDDTEQFNSIKSDFNGKLMKLNCSESDVQFNSIKNIETTKKASKEKPVIEITPMNVKNHPVLKEDYTLDTVGPKSYNLGLLDKRLSNIAEVPNSISIPCGMFDDVLNAPENKSISQQYHKKIKQVDSIQTRKETVKLLNEIKELVRQLKVPEKMQKEIYSSVDQNLNKGPKMARSSYNGEDLEKYAGAGLYDSYPCFNEKELIDKIKDVWSSKWNFRAYWSRRENNISHKAIQPTVLVQELIPVDHSFVVHTVHPITNNKDEVIIQLAQGLGEAIVSGHYPGQPYTFIYNKKTGNLERTNFANKSEKLVMTDKGFERALANYTDDKYCKPGESWKQDIINVAKTALEIEQKWGSVPQDIEGGIKDGKTYILQTRNQVFHN